MEFIEACVSCAQKSMFLSKNVYKWAKLYKEGWNSIPDKDRPSRPTMVCTAEMVDSVNLFILAERSVTIDKISEQLKISMDTAHKIIHDDLAFSKICCCWVSPGQFKAS